MMDSELPTSSPESTTATISDEECCLTKETAAAAPSKNDDRHWPVVLWTLTPCCIAVVSVVQVAMWLSAEAHMCRLLRWEPAYRAQAWRLVSYMLLHRGAMHLTLNILMQLLIASPLEYEQDGVRVSAVYVGGGVVGALGASLVQPQPLVGASAGVYALLISHLAHLYLNMSRLKNRKYRVFSVCVLVATDIACWCVYARAVSISMGAHGAGGVAGALLGLVAYRGDSRPLVRASATLITLLLFAGVILALALLPNSYFSN